MPVSLAAIADTRQLEHFISLAWGGGDGVIRGDGSEGAVIPTDPASMKVTMGTFRGFVSNRAVRLGAATDSAAITGPSDGSAGDLRRKDLVQWTLGVGVNIKAGTESATPTAPVADANSIVRAHIYCRKGMSSIKAADDSTNGYIVPIEAFV